MKNKDRNGLYAENAMGFKLSDAELQFRKLVEGKQSCVLKLREVVPEVTYVTSQLYEISNVAVRGTRVSFLTPLLPTHLSLLWCYDGPG